MKSQILIAACTAAFLASGAFVSTGNAAANATMKACGTQWSAMKTAGTVPAGMKWNDFLKTCAANSNSAATTPAVATPVAQAAPVAVAKPTLASKLKKLATSTAATAAATTAVAAAPAAASATGGTTGEQSRIKQCGVQWKASKSANTVPAGQTWPQFWSACDARLKAGG